ncbi:hypothetical protein [Defluviimonas salinarum]|uniref:Uncharacterized protein n=1 Tax=Defluviimonas salinarum TaxID=2992147 RepID=A0ABT3J5Q1_9RHOB|nr:hypothetical protein [Defluviimonas salinarum]MCW3783016.1 hypothetical protein [Defluviimonas salinarum]
MVWIKDEFGLAENYQGSLAEVEKMIAAKVPVYASLAGLILHEGVQATAFSSFGATKLYDGVLALERGTVIGLEPVSVTADYRVECFEGELLHPPLHREELREMFWARQLEETGERPWFVAMLDTAELTVFFTGASEGEVERKVADAVRKLHPEEKSLHTALANQADLSVTRGVASAPAGCSHAAAIRRKDGGATFFLAEDTPGIEDLVWAHFIRTRSKPDGAVPASFDNALEIAERKGDRIDIGHLWLSDALVEEAIEDRRRLADDGPTP